MITFFFFSGSFKKKIAKKLTPDFLDETIKSTGNFCMKDSLRNRTMNTVICSIEIHSLP